MAVLHIAVSAAVLAFALSGPFSRGLLAPQPQPRGHSVLAMSVEPSSEQPGADSGALPPVGETLRTLRPERITVEPLDLASPVALGTAISSDDTFVKIFRSCTPYIKMHQGCVMVIHIASEALERNELFDQLMEEVATLSLLGVKPVLVVGIQRQIDEALRLRGQPQPAFGDSMMRVTDEVTMRTVQEVNGFMRSRVEGALARGRARSGPGGSVGVDVVGGNFFYTAQPVGVRNGIDYGFTGEVRSVDTTKVRQHLDAGEIVLLTALGYSASGTVFNVRTEHVAAAAASFLEASKVIFMTPQRLMEFAEVTKPSMDFAEVTKPSMDFAEVTKPSMDFADAAHAEVRGGGARHVLQSMRMAEARKLLDYICNRDLCDAADAAATAVADSLEAAKAEGELVSSPGAGGADKATDGALRLPTAETLGAAAADVSKMCDLVGYCIKALERGVTRGHLLPPVPGALIQELYTTDGCGTLIARDVYDGIRLATAADVPGILALIGPLEAQGVLIKRSPDVLARDVHLGFYYVYTRDDTIVACAQLKRYSDTHAEVGCLVVNDQYRRQGCGDAMLGFLERTAAAAGVERLFALSTHTMQWFIERGFASCALVDLPPRRIAIYNHTRGSKIYMKPLQSARLLDAEELFWQGTLGRPKQGTRSR